MKNRADQGDAGLVFDGLATGTSYKYNAKFQNNKMDNISNPDRMNVGRGPTKVGSGSTGVGPKNPPTTATGKAQYRGVGGTSVPDCKYDINVGRGPTKGNSQ